MVVVIITAKLNGQIINCFDEYDKETLKKWADKKILLCPVCNKPYEYCHGRIKSPYFRHMDKAECEELYTEEETEEHINGKYNLYKWLTSIPNVSNVQLEVWIPETKQRPDIMFEFNNKQYVIEYQCSPISTEYIERHELYHAAGIIDIWICGVRKYFECFHDGNGSKRMNYLEYVARKYYDPFSDTFFFLDDSIKQNDIKEYLSEKNNLWYDGCQINNLIGSYKFIKLPSVNHYMGLAKPGRRDLSTFKKYNYFKNNSLAYCVKLNNLMKEVIVNG